MKISIKRGVSAQTTDASKPAPIKEENLDETHEGDSSSDEGVTAEAAPVEQGETVSALG